MIFDAHPAQQYPHEAVMSERAYSEQSIFPLADGSHKNVMQEYTANFKLIGLESGRLLIRLRDFPKIQFDQSNQRCEILGWGIQFPVAEVAQIQKIMARKFLTLLGRAEANPDGFDDPERKQWASILRQVDYQAFSSDRSPARYWQGTLVSTSPDVVVRWHTGEEQTISTPVSQALEILNIGERFGAFVKRDHRRKVVSIESIDILEHEAAPFAWPVT